MDTIARVAFEAFDTLTYKSAFVVFEASIETGLEFHGFYYGVNEFLRQYLINSLFPNLSLSRTGAVCYGMNKSVFKQRLHCTMAGSIGLFKMAITHFLELFR